MTFAVRIYEADSEESAYEQKRVEAESVATAAVEAQRLAQGRPFTVEIIRQEGAR
jgi:hypothetical protein